MDSTIKCQLYRLALYSLIEQISDVHNETLQNFSLVNTTISQTMTVMTMTLADVSVRKEN